MKVKLNDKVLVISGKSRGKTGRVMKVLTKDNKVVVEKLNIRTRHVKKTTSKAGEKIKFEAPLQVSNVAVICPSCSKATRVGHKILENGKKERVCKKCSQALDQKITESEGKTKSRVKKVKA